MMILGYRFKSFIILYAALLLFTTFGFFSHLDSTIQWGCVSYHYLTLENIAFAVVSIGLLTAAVFQKNKDIRIVLIVAESMLWFWKLYNYKGGYIVGIVGSTPVDIVLFDFTGIVLRIALLRTAIGLRFPFFIIFGIAGLMMIVKLYFFTF